MKADDIRYALAKHVPDLSRRVVFQTNYGALMLFDRDAQRVAVLVDKILRAQLKREEKHAAQRAARKTLRKSKR